MQLHTLSLVLLGLHLLADFHLQGEMLAREKRQRLAALLLHGLVYSACMALPLMWDTSLWPITLVLSASHLLVDAIKGKAWHEAGEQKEILLFFADQGLHLVMLVLCCQVFFANQASSFLPNINREAVKWAVLLLLITKPANITMKLVLARFASLGQAGDTAHTSPVPGAGALIGSLERVLVAILLGLTQFAAIGLVFTAKSIARFDRIAKDQGFAEYYLIGSLLSLLLVIAAWLVLFSWIA